MLRINHSDGLCWSSFFSIKSDMEKERILRDIQKIYFDYDSQYLKNQMLMVTGLSDMQNSISDSSIIEEACEYVALKFMIEQTTLAKELLIEEDYIKSQNLLKRRQFDSKILKSLLNSFSLLIKNREEWEYTENLKNLFTLPIFEQIQSAKEENVNREFNNLKKVIEKVCSGVKAECYVNAKIGENYLFLYKLNSSLNEFVKKNFDYDFDIFYRNLAYNESSTLLHETRDLINNKILQLALYDNAKFWNKHQDFSVIMFINEIEKLNGERHAEKVLTFIFNNLKKFPNMDIVLKNKFPLYMSKYDDLVSALESQTQRFTFKKLEQYCDIAKVQGIPLCYPMSNVDEETIAAGEKIWNDFICKYNYPNDYKKVMKYLNDEVELFASGSTEKNNIIAIILDGSTFRYSGYNEDRRLFKAYHEDCFSAENIWKRVYLKAYAVTMLSADEEKQFSFIQRIFIDLIKTIEENLGICTIHQLDTKERDEKYEKLKKKLECFNIEISDNKKENYVISLLDRDTAVIEESLKFPALEQVGDAIYNFAVAESLFYNPNIKNMSKKFEDYKRAETQVLIANKIGLNHLFIHSGLPAKYIEYDTMFFDYETINEEYLQTLNNEKYLADSLEMIIASIYFDKGLSVAIDFTKNLLKQTFPNDFSNEVRLSDENRLDEQISEFHWMQILPAPHSDMNINQVLMWDALNKLVLTIAIGCEDKEKRKFITINYNKLSIYGEKEIYGINWVFYKYLTDGLNSVLEKYSDIIRENYLNKKN